MERRSIWAFTAFCLLVLCVFSRPLLIEAVLKDGSLAKKFDEYESLIKCMLNIAEDVLPKLDDYIGCCGYWAIHDFLIHKLSKDCYSRDLDQIKHLVGLVDPQVRTHCAAYPQGSFTCRLLVIMPITFFALFFIFFLGINVCACTMFCKWRNSRTKLRKAKEQLTSLGVNPKKTFYRNRPAGFDAFEQMKPLKSSKLANNA